MINRLFKCYFVIFFLMLSTEIHAGFSKQLWNHWIVHQPTSTKHINHQRWQHFLDVYIIDNDEQINVVNYAAVTDADKKQLLQYLNEMAALPISEYNRHEQLAYWINLYNALTVYTILRYYPVTNIQDINISPGLFSMGPWGANIIHIENHDLSLDDINHRIIRPIWHDPRVHYVLNNGSLGAPELSRFAYDGDSIEKRLNEAARRYINSLRGIQVIEGRLIASKIFSWYLEDFGDDEADVITHIRLYANKTLQNQLTHINSIDSYFYNWHLNAPHH